MNETKVSWLSWDQRVLCSARAVKTEAEIHRYTRVMSAMSAVYLALAFGLTKVSAKDIDD